MKSLYSLVISLGIISLAATSCKKDCYDKELEQRYEAISCTQDCPGVTGCDGNFYCNACIAASQGIRVED